MQIPSLQLITLDNISDPSKADQAIISQLNTTQATLYSALQGRLTLIQNITAQIQSVNLTTTSNYTEGNFAVMSFKRTLPYVASHLLLTKVVNNNGPYAKNTGIITATNWQDNNGVIEIYFITGLQNSTPYTFTFLIL
jgi:hypothetical protein